MNKVSIFRRRDEGLDPGMPKHLSKGEGFFFSLRRARNKIDVLSCSPVSCDWVSPSWQCAGRIIRMHHLPWVVYVRRLHLDATCSTSLYLRCTSFTVASVMFFFVTACALVSFRTAPLRRETSSQNTQTQAATVQPEFFNLKSQLSNHVLYPSKKTLSAPNSQTQSPLLPASMVTYPWPYCTHCTSINLSVSSRRQRAHILNHPLPYQAH